MSVKKKKSKVSSIEDLIQKYLNTSDGPGKKILLGMIKLKDPKFKG